MSKSPKDSQGSDSAMFGGSVTYRDRKVGWEGAGVAFGRSWVESMDFCQTHMYFITVRLLHSQVKKLYRNTNSFIYWHQFRIEDFPNL